MIEADGSSSQMRSARDDVHPVERSGHRERAENGHENDDSG